MGSKPTVFARDVCVIAPSAICNGNGVFANCNLKAGTVILFDRGTKWWGRFNDADLQPFPKNFTYNELSQAFRRYQSNDRCTAQLCAADRDKDLDAVERCTVRRPVSAGQELTKRYGLKMWALWFLREIADPEFPMRQLPAPIDKEARKVAFANLQRALTEHACQLSLTKTENGLPKMYNGEIIG